MLEAVAEFNANVPYAGITAGMGQGGTDVQEATVAAVMALMPQQLAPGKRCCAYCVIIVVFSSVSGPSMYGTRVGQLPDGTRWYHWNCVLQRERCSITLTVFRRRDGCPPAPRRRSARRGGAALPATPGGQQHDGGDAASSAQFPVPRFCDAVLRLDARRRGGVPPADAAVRPGCRPAGRCAVEPSGCAGGCSCGRRNGYVSGTRRAMGEAVPVIVRNSVAEAHCYTRHEGLLMRCTYRSFFRTIELKHEAVFVGSGERRDAMAPENGAQENTIAKAAKTLSFNSMVLRER